MTQTPDPMYNSSQVGEDADTERAGELFELGAYRQRRPSEVIAEHIAPAPDSAVETGELKPAPPVVLYDAGWTPMDRNGRRIWLDPESGFYYSEHVAGLIEGRRQEDD